ncbi:hypothetical protein V9L05_07540 [Bernardetia sp. Wsw4-3y2]|uniref:hypothetical protein n=1 Tax=Bernardetia sp. Wsw4-3y2 TaxID=3127471 RepID=UPI0030CD88B0
MAKKATTTSDKMNGFNIYRVTGGGVRKQFMDAEPAQKYFETRERALKKKEEGFSLKLYAAIKVVGEKTEWILLQETSYSDDSFED